MTPQRLLLLDLLHHGEHLDTDELYRRARDKEPPSISTVYRNLRLFLKLGLVEEHHFNNAHSCYEMKTDVGHHHLICLGCGKIIEFECPLCQEMKGNLEARNGFHITGTTILLAGFCTECYKQKENDMNSRSSSQSKISHLTKMTDFSASFYDSYYKLLLRQENSFRQKTHKQGNRVEYRVATSLALPFDSETFEIVVTSLIYHQLMSWQERVKTVSEIWRVLRPGGRYVSAEFTRFTPGNLIAMRDSLIRKFPLFGLDLLEENGFRITEKMKTTKRIMIISAKKVARQDVLFNEVMRN